MKRRIELFLILICALALVTQFTSFAIAGGTPAEAEALVENAMRYFQENGKDKAILAFNDPQGEFVNGELYIFMFGYDGVCVAHGYNPKLIGKNLTELKDANGVAFIQEFAVKAKNGGGWVDYQWTNPVTQKVQAKSSYVKGLEGTDLYVGCGIYK